MGGTASTATSLSELLNEFKTILDDSSITYSNLADVIYTKFNPIYQVYTVRIDTTNSDPETALTYLDDAVGMTPGYDGWKDTKIIKNIKPCVLNNGEVQYYLQKDNYTLKEDGTTSVLDGTDGDVMVEIPKIGYRLWKDSNYQYISITDDPDKEGYCYYAHSLNSAGDCSKLYIGAYLSNMNGRSYSG